jgi:hypothetical protein
MLSILGSTEVEDLPAVYIAPLTVELPFAFFCARLPMLLKTPVIPPPSTFPPSATPLGALVRTSNIPFPICSKADGVGQPRPGNPLFELLFDWPWSLSRKRFIPSLSARA